MSLNLQVPGWVAKAVCAQIDPELFFPDKGAAPTVAKKVCRSCPARVACLGYALDLARDGEVVRGIWGGTTERERRDLRGLRKCRDCDVEIPSGKGAALRCEEHREQRRRDSKNAYVGRQKAAA